MPSALALVPLLALASGASADAPTYEIDVADVSNAPDACPSRDQVAETLEAHLPGILARPGHDAGPNLLRLALALSAEGVVRLTMTDATGGLRLERELDLPKSEGAAPGRPPGHERSACAEIADTVALIVERYMRHLGYHEPPAPSLVAPSGPPPPPPPVEPPRPGADVRLGVGLSARPPWSASWRLEPGLTGAVRLGHLDLGGSFAAGLPVVEPVPMSGGTGTLQLTTLPVRVAVGWALAATSRVSVIPAVVGGIDVVLAETRGIDKTRSSAAVEPTIEGGLTGLVALTRRVWIDLHAFQGIDLRPEEFQVMGSKPVTILMTPRVYARVGVDFGMFLGKK